jgi:glycosyltransferase involved in cell wall biosynthesis
VRVSRLTDVLRACTVDPRAARPGGALRVAHLLPSVGWGGAERLACTIHRLCLEQGLRSRVDAPSVEALDAGIASETGAPRGPRRAGEDTLRGWALAARARVHRERPDVVHAHLPYPDRLGAALVAARGRPLVATFQLLPEVGRYWSLDDVLGIRSDRALSLLSRVPRAARYVAVSANDTTRLAQLLPPHRLVRIANAPPLPRAVLPSLPPLAWPEGCVRLLSVGRLHRQKGFDRVLAALADARVRALPWHWVVAGDGPERAALETALEAMGLVGRVSFAPAHPASTLYPTAELVLSPSRWEGMPLVPMEAVEAGVPVLCSSIEPHRELFARAPASMLPDDEAQWPSRLAVLLASAAARDELVRAQRAVLPADPRREMWEAYAALYRAVSRK